VIERICRPFQIVTVGLAIVVVAAAVLYFSRTAPSLPYQDSFSSGKTGEWRAYAGSWETHEGAIRNLSEERGAKLITGSSEWTDYSFEADLMLLGQSGDAGLIVRSSDEEDGVDSYSGYYAGLRLPNDLVIGRADHGWMEYQAAPIPVPLRTFKWYHLKMVAVGCDVTAVASDPETGQSTIAALREKDCVRTGRIGLRSYSAGGAWRRVMVTRATTAELMAIEAGTQVVSSPEVMQTEAGFSAIMARSARRGSISRQAAVARRSAASQKQTPTIKSLRQVFGLHPPLVTVRGNVVLTSPILYIEDSTGGLAIDGGNGASLKLGDEVEATGIIESRGFSAILRQATVRLLWSREPPPPLSVTAAQAATGAFDGMYIEIEGSLGAQPKMAPQSVAMDLTSGNHNYRAILSGARPEEVLNGLMPRSLLRLRGVCVVDPEHSKSLTPFVLFLRSAGDVGVISGPPWWDVRHLGEIGLALIPLTLIAVLIYTRAEHWRMRAVVEERSRMAREIHDTLAQGFAGIALQLESVLQKPWAKEVEIEPVAVACNMAQQSRREAHRSIAALRTLHTEAGLEDMLRKLLLTQVAGSQVALRVTATGTPQRLSGDRTSQVLRIAQEAVANALQHSLATKIAVRLEFEPDKVSVQIADDGRGFDVRRAPVAEEGHFGITGMKERAANMKADFSIQSDNSGTRITVQVPIPRRQGQFWHRVLWWRPTFKTSIQLADQHRNARG
jgi:anti-sigma regulatory factor (Ser/Thr protein kinase)